MPNGVKTRFAGLLRELLRRFDETETGADVLHPQAPHSGAADMPPSPQPPVPQRAPVPQRTAPQPTFAASSAVPKPVASGDITEVELALPLVLENLPPRLRARLTLTGHDAGHASISIPVSKIMSQLALGAIKITFGELRDASPGLFNIDAEYDSLPVVLPLNEILARLSPNFLMRNPTQKAVTVPEDITGPFGGRGEGISFSTAPLKSTPPPAPPIRVAMPPARPPAKATPPPVAPPPPPFVPRSNVADRPAPSMPRTSNGSGNGAPAQPIIPNFSIPFRPAAPKPSAVPKLPAMPKPPTAAPAAGSLLASLAALSENWPESLRSEIGQLISANAQVALPVDLVESALKRGRVMFTWQELRSWIKPQPPAASVHDNLELELPLKVIAPLFLSRPGAAKPVQPHRPKPLPEEIPNLFFGFPQPQPPSEILQPSGKTPLPDETRFASKPAELRGQDTNFYTWVESDTTFLTARPGETEFKRLPAASAVPATDFSSRYTPPKEIVSRARALAGVAGALVALPDGLTVASEIPSGFNPDTLAAFLPQIYGRVSQCTKELRMGDLNNLNFTVGNVPWKIFRIHGVYFAAFGRAGQQLPTAQLAQLAAELDRKKQ